MKQKSAFTVALTILLAVSIFFNISLYQEQKQAKEKIEKFLPAAVQLENEMTMLKNNNAELLTQLTQLQTNSDTASKKSSSYTATAPMPTPSITEPTVAQPSIAVPRSDVSDFRDLQRPNNQ